MNRSRNTHSGIAANLALLTALAIVGSGVFWFITYILSLDSTDSDYGQSIGFAVLIILGGSLAVALVPLLTAYLLSRAEEVKRNHLLLLGSGCFIAGLLFFEFLPSLFFVLAAYSYYQLDRRTERSLWRWLARAGITFSILFAFLSGISAVL